MRQTGQYDEQCGVEEQNFTIFVCSNPGDPLKSHLIITQSDEARMVLYLSLTHSAHKGMIYKHGNSIEDGLDEISVVSDE
jgi:hypothetical protein